MASNGSKPMPLVPVALEVALADSQRVMVVADRRSTASISLLSLAAEAADSVLSSKTCLVVHRQVVGVGALGLIRLMGPMVPKIHKPV